MDVFLHPRWRCILGILSLVWVFLIAGSQLSGLQQIYPLPASEIHHDADCAYIFELNRPFGWPITTFVGDTSGAPTASSLLLLEGGRPIGRPHTLHHTIRTNGSGTYSHWGSTLWFSASDCSDPRSNDRSYEVNIPIDLSRWVYVSWFIFPAIFFSTIKKRLATNRRVRTLIDCARNASISMFSPLNISQRPLLGLFLFFLLVLGAWSFLAGVWRAGISNNNALAGFYQVSDAGGYWSCSNTLLAKWTSWNQSTLSEWCQRRAIYPTFLSGVAVLGGRDIFGTLWMQALLVSTAIFITVRRSSPYVGAIGAAISTVLLFRFGVVHFFPLTMTENFGIIFGCVGWALLIKASEIRSPTGVFGGIALVSLAINARAGAFLILPCLILWAGIAAYSLRQRIWQWVVLASFATLMGFVLQAGLVIVNGGNPGHSFGNFSYTLYGLSVGGKAWNQVYVDHPEISELSDSEAAKTVYALAWDNLIEQPAQFLLGLLKNIRKFYYRGIYDPGNMWWSIPMRIFWVFAWIPMLLNFRHPIHSLVALSSLGVMLSLPILLNDGGERVFAATAAVEVIQMSLGVYFAGRIVRQGAKGFFVTNLEQSLGKPSRVIPGKLSLELMFGLLLLAILVIPFTPLRHLHAQTQVDVAGCSDGEYTVATQIGKGGTILLDFVSDSQQANFLLGEISRKAFTEGMAHWVQWREEAIAFGETSILIAYQLGANDPNAPGPYHVFSGEHLAKYNEHLVRLCVDKTEQKVIFGRPYRKLNSISILD